MKRVYHTTCPLCSTIVERPTRYMLPIAMNEHILERHHREANEVRIKLMDLRALKRLINKLKKEVKEQYGFTIID